jgi:phosphoserine phosphatase RsbX
VPDRAGVVEWCVAGRPIPGEDQSGDDALVLADEGIVLVAAVDGLGHGPGAREAADAAVASLRQDPGDDVVALTERCHEALRSTRGAAIGLAVFRDGGTVTWLGIGNITGRLVSRGGLSAPERRWLSCQSGIAGDDDLPPLHPTAIPVRRGDVLILATDGIDESFGDSVAVSGTCEEIAGRVLDEYARATDDALVVVARYLAEDA